MLQIQDVKPFLHMSTHQLPCELFAVFHLKSVPLVFGPVVCYVKPEGTTYTTFHTCKVAQPFNSVVSSQENASLGAVALPDGGGRGGIDFGDQQRMKRLHVFLVKDLVYFLWLQTHWWW
jgi:hypothetical protein